MRVLIDMDLSPNWQAFLERSGHTANQWSTLGAHDAPDHELMEWAKRNVAILLTADLDFSAILAAKRDNRPSVVQLRCDAPTTQVMGSVVVEALKILKHEIEAGATVTLDASHRRVRVLPLEIRGPA